MPSLLWRCWLGDRKGIRPVKNEWWGVGVVVCLERGADLHTAQLMPLPLTVSCSSKIQISFTFLVPAYPGYPGKEAVKWLLLLLLSFRINDRILSACIFYILWQIYFYWWHGGLMVWPLGDLCLFRFQVTTWGKLFICVPLSSCSII